MPRAELMTIEQLFRLAEKHALPSGWLFLDKRQMLSLDTNAMIIDAKFNEDTIQLEIPAKAEKYHLSESINSDTFTQIVKHANRHLETPASKETLLEALNYYLQYDAPLPELGFTPD